MNVSVRGRTRHYRTVAFNAARNSVVLIEQRLLPHQFRLVTTRDFRETARAISESIVRELASEASRSVQPAGYDAQRNNIASFSRPGSGPLMVSRNL